eukprot:6174970-Pleurochrysis_carterae.AAC.1
MMAPTPSFTSLAAVHLSGVRVLPTANSARVIIISTSPPMPPSNCLTERVQSRAWVVVLVPLSFSAFRTARSPSDVRARL